MIELLAIFLEVAGEFIITFLLEMVGDGLFLFIPEMQGRRYYQVCTAWFLAVVGVILGGLTTFVLPNLLIRSLGLQILNIVISPVIIGLLFRNRGKRRILKEKPAGKLSRFFYGYVFALMVTLSRFVFTGEL